MSTLGPKAFHKRCCSKVIKQIQNRRVCQKKSYP